jgi:hypothetical protein
MRLAHDRRGANGRLRRAGAGAVRSVAVSLLVGAALLSALGARAGAATLPGAPLVVSVGPQGQCQSNYVGAANNFFPGSGQLGDCGFFLAFPKAGNPAAIRERVFGFAGTKGPGLEASEYVPVGTGSATGTGTPSDPYKLVTSFKVTDAASKLDYALVTETTTYVNGEPQFTSSFDVENVTGQSVEGLTPQPTAETLKFHAIYAGDLFTDGTDFGTGVLLAGPPRFVGGQNSATGVLGGFVEASSPSPQWSNYESGCATVVPEPLGACPATSARDGGVWASVRAASAEGPVFDDDIDPNLVDNAVGVSWDDLSSGLAPGAHVTYAIVNRARIPTGLTVTPVSQTHTVGQTATVSVTAKDSTGAPYANRPIVYSIGDSNPKLGSVTTDSSGMATISYVGTAAGLDTMQMFLDLAETGTQTQQDPASAAQVSWTAAAPSAARSNSAYRVRSIHANPDGTITVVFVPVQSGTATAEVTVPTAAVERDATRAARQRGCKRGQVRIAGRCLARTTVSGKVSASARAGVALRLTVRASSKVKRALATGKTVPLTAKLSYRSRLGGRASVQSFQLKVKGRRPKKRR